MTPPARRTRAKAADKTGGSDDAAGGTPHIARGADAMTLDIGGRRVPLTHLSKVFWPETVTTKGELLNYYLDIAPALLPHIRRRAMVMKRYPNGVDGKFFFMKRAPASRPDWIRTCAIEHASGSVIEFPVVDDLASLMWIINLGCIDLNPWYARCDDVDRPDYLHFDLDPGQAAFEQVVESAFVLREMLEAIAMPTHVKKSGSKGSTSTCLSRAGLRRRSYGRLPRRSPRSLPRRDRSS